MSEGKDDMAEGKRQLEAERAKQARDVTAAFFRGVCREVHAARSVDEEPPNVAQAGASPPLSPKKAPTASLVSVLRNAGPSIPAASAPGGGGGESGEGKRVSFNTNIMDAQKPKKRSPRHHHHGTSRMWRSQATTCPSSSSSKC